MIKIAKLRRPVKMGTRKYGYCLHGCNKFLDSDSYREFIGRVTKESVKGYYFGYGQGILFQDKSDAQYFAMQATFIKSREPEKIQMATNANWKQSYLYNYGFQKFISNYYRERCLDKKGELKGSPSLYILLLCCYSIYNFLMF